MPGTCIPATEPLPGVTSSVGKSRAITLMAFPWYGLQHSAARSVGELAHTGQDIGYLSGGTDPPLLVIVVRAAALTLTMGRMGGGLG